MKGIFLVIIWILCSIRAVAQTPVDALYMNHKQVCLAGFYQRSQWSRYWEGTNKRDNPNIGNVTHQSAMFMGAVGVTPRLNLLAGLPYITSSASKGQLAGQQGLQDLSVWLKYRAVDHKIGSSKLKVFALGGVSAPMSDYVPDFLPLCIGLQAKTLTFRSVVDFKTENGFYLTIRAGHTWRSNITIDRNAYQYDGKLYYTNEVVLPNVLDAGAHLGWRKGPWVGALTLDHFSCRSGDDIRPNDMPFPTNKMAASAAGFLGKYQAKHWGFTLMANQVFAGRNTGQGLNLQTGLLYLFKYKSPE
jgi:hypothetical protein